MQQDTQIATKAAASFSKSTCDPRSVPSTHNGGFPIITGSRVARSQIDSGLVYSGMVSATVVYSFFSCYSPYSIPSL